MKNARTLTGRMHGWQLFALLSAALAGATRPGQAQTFGFEYRPLAKVADGAQTLRNAWAGGLNSPQFSNIDLNADQQPDLYVFDRATNRSFTYLSVPAAGGARAWEYAPAYEALFPAGLVGWVLLRDYDCDGRPDLFTYANGGDIRVYRHVPDAQGRPGFQLLTDQLTYFAPGPTGGNVNINTGGYNLPAIEDVNGDGRLDVLTYDFSSPVPSIYYYRNTATAGSCGGLQLVEETSYWGGLTACLSGCGGYTFAPNRCRPDGQRPTHTGGFNISLRDLDGDGDQDLLTARDMCPELVSIRNDGSAQTAVFSSAGLSLSFPAGTTAAHVPNFPAAYSVDATFDGRPDLVVAPNLFDNQDTVDLRRSTWLYRNSAAAGAAPIFGLLQSDFLQRDMLDLSEVAAPALGDLDGDGLVDLLVGSTSRDTPGQMYRATLRYFRNVGTAAEPTFQLVDNDYLGLSQRKLTTVKPLLVDLNRDGALDLVYTGARLGSSDSRVAVLLNAAPAGQAVAFNAAAPLYLENLPGRRGDAPCFADVDGDGRLDLLLGTNSLDTPGMSLRYYRNTGAAQLSQAFQLADNDYGRLRTSTGRPANLHPVVADFDGDTRPDLLTADGSGAIRFFSDFRAQGSALTERTDLFYNPLLNQLLPARLGSGAAVRFAPAAADLNADGAPELLLGLENGGLHLFGTRGRAVLSTRRPASSLLVRLYPNPATSSVTVEAPRPVRLTLLDLTGRTLRHSATSAARHTLDVSLLAAGVYLVRCETADGQQTTQRVEVVK
ncbi:T9SS type A sorting domain-containing protein [Hymenobacter weizhouensis]|uniref:T9SS type A sorting domain-containing protein n=1 Tax=Hymenobacter sp. YIM 151500-1 TaxID=2987689 RepID=UPI00222749D5|nr:T9SS type A sorting domain-containing protein [Hymenobacter sp. YIM 151500-1]UYZ62690.1 T9SS type A sorting domain-containing protein [Hymenobacter sp. YIM 151500-1]